MMILGFLFLLLAVWYWIRNHDRKGGTISALLLAVVGVISSALPTLITWTNSGLQSHHQLRRLKRPSPSQSRSPKVNHATRLWMTLHIPRWLKI